MIALRSHSQLVRICREIAEDDGPAGHYQARPRVLHARTDAAAAIARGLPALTVSRGGDTVGPDELDGALAFCRELILRLDHEVGPDLAEVRSAAGSAA